MLRYVVITHNLLKATVKMNRLERRPFSEDLKFVIVPCSLNGRTILMNATTPTRTHTLLMMVECFSCWYLARSFGVTSLTSAKHSRHRLHDQLCYFSDGNVPTHAICKGCSTCFVL